MKYKKKLMDATKRTALVFRGVSLHDPIIKPHVSNSHPVLRECAGLIGADGWRWAQGLYSL